MGLFPVRSIDEARQEVAVTQMHAIEDSNRCHARAHTLWRHGKLRQGLNPYA
jgi:hypothetical protein